MKLKEKEKQKPKLVQKNLKQILNKNKSKPIEIRTKVNKMEKMHISKTNSMENINKSKNTARVKSSNPQKIFNNSMEELDYLNFSDLDIDLFKKNSSFEEDIFNPKYYAKNKREGKNQIVQNRYNMIDTSFDTIKSVNIITDSCDDYIDANKNKLLKTPSTICNYYDKSEISSEQKKKNKSKTNCINMHKNNKKEKEATKEEEKEMDNEKKIKFKKLKNKSIQIPNNNKNHNIINNNQPMYSNRTNRAQPPKTFSSSNIKLTQNNNSNKKNNNNFYNNKKGNTTSNFMPRSKKIVKEEVSSSILKKRNTEMKSNIYSKIKNQNNLMKNYLKSGVDKNKNNPNNINKKKSFSTKNYSGAGNITSQILQNKKGFTNINFTYNKDMSNYINKKKNEQNLLKSLNEQKNEKGNRNNDILNNENDKESPKQEDIIPQKQQKPIMLCLDKSKFNMYFITSTNSNSDKKNLSNSKKEDIGKNSDYLNIKINNNIALDSDNYNYTGRNVQNGFNTRKKDIIVKRKKLNKTNTNINPCTKSINSNMNINTNTNTNTTFTNNQNDKPIIKVNLKKHIKSSSELIKFINVDIKNKNNKNPKNNKSFVSTCTRGSINTSQVVKELLSKKKILKSPSQINNNTLKISKTMKENNLNKIKTTPKYNKIYRGDNFSTLEKKSYIGSNQKGYYSIKYELNLKNNNNSNISKSKNKLIKNSFKPKTQSDIKVNKYKIKEEENSKKSNKENKENKDNNNDYGMDKRVKQKLLDRMNKVSKNNFGYIWGGNLGLPKKDVPEIFYDVMKSPNKDYLLGNNFYYNNKIISNENSKNDERDFDKKDNINDKRNKKEITIIKEYNASKLSKTYI